MASAGEGRGSLIGRGPLSRLVAQASLPTGSAPFLSPFVGVTANNHARLSSHLDSSHAARASQAGQTGSRGRTNQCLMEPKMAPMADIRLVRPGGWGLLACLLAACSDPAALQLLRNPPFLLLVLLRPSHTHTPPAGGARPPPNAAFMQPSHAGFRVS